MARKKGVALLDPAPPWDEERSRHLILWHGCTVWDKDQIEANGIDLRYCRVNADFGRGFYTTTIKRQAEHWAWERARSAKLNLGMDRKAVLLRFRVPRNRIGKLLSLHFVHGAFENEDLWSLVQHCRQSTPAGRGRPEVVHDHRIPPTGWFDMVSGPVASFWTQRKAMEGADQVSFHTPKAIKIFNDLIARGNAGRGTAYRWELVAER